MRAALWRIAEHASASRLHTGRTTSFHGVLAGVEIGSRLLLADVAALGLTAQVHLVLLHLLLATAVRLGMLVLVLGVLLLLIATLVTLITRALAAAALTVVLGLTV